MTIERSSILGNEASQGGGLVVDSFGTLLMINTTVAANLAQSSSGVLASSGQALLFQVTISGNRAVDLDVDDDLGAFVPLTRSIVANNLDDTGPEDCAGTVFSGDYNLIGARATCTLIGTTTHVNASDVDPLLGPLVPIGGFAIGQTAAASAAVGVVPPAGCTDLGAPLGVDGRGYSRVGPCDIGATQLSGGYAPDPLLGTELLRNGGVAGNELGEAAVGSDPASPPPYWALEAGDPGQVVYGVGGDYPDRAGAPAGSGGYFCAGGAEPASIVSQTIDLSGVAARIDAGGLPFRASGAFGGYATEDDYAVMTIDFLDGRGSSLGDVTLGGFKAAQRGNSTKLLPDAATGTVPSGTRFAIVDLEAVRVSNAGVANNGYADALSFVVPEPAAALQIAAACAALGFLATPRVRPDPAERHCGGR